jgi:hypothetical protein
MKVGVISLFDDDPLGGTTILINCFPNDAVVSLFLLGHHSGYVAGIRVIAT